MLIAIPSAAKRYMTNNAQPVVTTCSKKLLSVNGLDKDRPRKPVRGRSNFNRCNYVIYNVLATVSMVYPDALLYTILMIDGKLRNAKT